MSKTITIGVAAYNVEAFLPICLDSVIKQKGDDIEIIIVDDGSKDKSGGICDEYAQKDSRIKVIHKENGGLSTVRNVTVDNAEGDWICFVDGDDMLTDDAVEVIKEKLDTTYPIIYFDAVYFENAKSMLSPHPYSVDMPDMEVTGKLLEQFALQTLCPGANNYNFVNRTIITSWGKVYKRDFLIDNNLRFEPLAFKGQDLVFNTYCMPYLDKVLLVRKPIYLYRIFEGSITNRYNPKIIEYNDNLAMMLHKHVMNVDCDYRDELIGRYYERCIRYIKITCDLYFCNRKNKMSYKERERNFLSYIGRPWCVEAISNCDPTDFTEPDLVIYNCIVKKDFKAICTIIKKGEIKRKINKALGLVGIKKFRI